MVGSNHEISDEQKVAITDFLSSLLGYHPLWIERGIQLYKDIQLGIMNDLSDPNEWKKEAERLHSDNYLMQAKKVLVKMGLLTRKVERKGGVKVVYGHTNADHSLTTLRSLSDEKFNSIFLLLRDLGEKWPDIKFDQTKYAKMKDKADVANGTMGKGVRRKKRPDRNGV